ncbi:TPA: HNH endonuclease [Klebsiella pneumoniae]
MLLPAYALNVGEKQPTLIEHCKAGFDHWSNGLWLRADIHRLFDSGICAVDPETLRIHFSPGVLKEDKDLSELEGKQLLATKKPVNTDYLGKRTARAVWS